MNGSASERDGAAHRLKREDTVWPIDPISLRPCLLCGLAGRISVPRLRLILVSLAGHLLLSISKLIHLSERCQMQRGKKIVMWWSRLSSKLCVVFNKLPLVFLNEKEFYVEKSWNCAIYPTVFLKDWVMNSFSRACKCIWILDDGFLFPPLHELLKVM